MRRRTRLIFPLALVAVVAVAAIAVAADDGAGGGTSTGASADAPTAYAAGGGNRERGRRFHGGPPDADVRAVLDDIRKAIAAQAPAIAGPVIDKAEKDGKITASQADALRKAAQDLADGKRPDPRVIGRDPDVHEVVHDAFAAAAEKAPGIAEPIIAKAVTEKRITETQAERIREMLKRPHRGPGFGGGPPPIGDADVRAVLEDVHAAVAGQAPEIAGTVIDKAEQDGKISAAQADRLRKAAADFAGRKPHGFPPGGLDLRDSDVRAVLHDVFSAVAAKTPGIAKPIIDKAVEDGDITAAQGRRLNRFLGHVGPLRHGPPPSAAPGRPS
jgi:hypothetical protein